ncbi:MAG TPA: DUF4214 domain-containing protein [Pirellulales bacterium]|nr:DUF4214 domain-containing protein [Pirellulales bacterium]
MPEPFSISLPRRDSKRNRRNSQSRSRTFGVERLECRRVLTAPAVTDVTPFGLAGATVTVDGSGFTGATTVDFVNSSNASTAGTNLNVINGNELTITVPSLALGTYDVTVTTPGGTSARTSTDLYAEVSPAVVAATKFTNTGTPVVSTVSTLNVVSTADFTPTGDLFVETTNGVATMHYTGVTATSFTGVSVVSGDPFNVGASDTTGLLNTTYPAVFQATHQTFEYTIQNQTGLPAGSQNNVTFAAYWSSVGDGSTTAPTFYYLNSPNANGSGGTFSLASNLTVGSSLPTYTVANSGGSTTIDLPYMPLNSLRFVFGVGTTPPVTVTQNSSNDVTITAPSPVTTNAYYDFVEETVDASGADNSVPNAARFLPTVNINTSQVDQFGLPITLTGMNNDNGTNQLTSVGVTLSPNVSRSAIFADYSSLHPAGSDPYAGLVIASGDPTQPYRIENPGKVSITTAMPLGYVFDNPIDQLFETGSSTLSLTSGGNTYTGTRTTVSAMGSDNAMHSYDVLNFTGPGLGVNGINVFEPFFSTNAPTGSPLPATAALYQGKPPAPHWLASSSETAGQMVFGNDGVFADAGLQSGLTSTEQTVLGDLENQIVAALNRGVANLYSTTAAWQNSANFYPTGQVANEYAAFLHQQSISGTPIFIDGKAYAIAYDDQGGDNPSLVLLNQDGITTTLGPWTSSSPNPNAAFISAVYQDVLHRSAATQELDYWLGQLTNGETRVQVSQDIDTSVEAHTDIIEGFYTSLLNRSADPQGLSYFLNLFANGWTQIQIKSLFYGSDEYFQVRGGGTDAGFLDALYHDEFNRAPDSGGEAYFTQLLASGQSRSDVAGLILNSQEDYQTQVNSYYLAYLSRPADANGLAYWVSVLAADPRDSLVQSGILGSDEYYAQA